MKLTETISHADGTKEQRYTFNVVANIVCQAYDLAPLPGSDQGNGEDRDGCVE